MEVASGLIKLRPDAEQAQGEWQAAMSSRVNEVMQSLKAEGVQLESWFKVELAGESYLLWYMRAESLQKAVEVFQQSTKAIDLFHFQALSEFAVKDGHIETELLLHFENSD
ncbi:DUF6176 family protein [Photobacterium swingsii]|uniref:DUF6176 family protein n=1 Tax=Photobacterium swingsii TaxID=680026 RepID=UPI003D11BB31